MAIQQFTWSSLLIRFLFACLLVLGSYNPSGYSYTHWVLNNLPDSIDAISAFVGIILIIGWVIYLRATWNSLGPIGLLLAMAFFGAFIWIMVDFGLLATDNQGVISWIILFITSAILAVGMSWSHIRRRMTGQVDTDAVDTE